MNVLPHWAEVLLQAAAELVFALVALPLYVFLVLPKYDAGVLPGFSPVIAQDANPYLAVALAVVVFLAAVGFALFLVRVAGKERVITEEISTLATNYSILDMVPVYAAAGFAEEFLFRVVLIDLVGFVIASVLFAAAHFAYWKHPYLLVDVFVVALLIGGLYLYTQSLLLCALAHFAYNMAITYLTKTRFAFL